MVRRDGLAFEPAAARTAALVFRPDVYRSAIVGTSEPLAGASSKVEASLAQPTAVGM